MMTSVCRRILQMARGASHIHHAVVTSDGAYAVVSREFPSEERIEQIVEDLRRVGIRRAYLARLTGAYHSSRETRLTGIRPLRDAKRKDWPAAAEGFAWIRGRTYPRTKTLIDWGGE